MLLFGSHVCGIPVLIDEKLTTKMCGCAKLGFLSKSFVLWPIIEEKIILVVIYWSILINFVTHNYTCLTIGHLCHFKRFRN